MVLADRRLASRHPGPAAVRPLGQSALVDEDVRLPLRGSVLWVRASASSSGPPRLAGRQASPATTSCRAHRLTDRRWIPRYRAPSLQPVVEDRQRFLYFERIELPPHPRRIPYPFGVPAAPLALSRGRRRTPPAFPGARAPSTGTRAARAPAARACA